MRSPHFLFDIMRITHITAFMTSARYIREIIFGITTQTEFAELLDMNQSRISRFEKGDPLSARFQNSVAALAKKKGLTFDHALFFRALTEDERAELNDQPLAEAG